MKLRKRGITTQIDLFPKRNQMKCWLPITNIIGTVSAMLNTSFSNKIVGVPDSNRFAAPLIHHVYIHSGKDWWRQIDNWFIYPCLGSKSIRSARARSSSKSSRSCVFGRGVGRWWSGNRFIQSAREWKVSDRMEKETDGMEGWRGRLMKRNWRLLE